MRKHPLCLWLGPVAIWLSLCLPVQGQRIIVNSQGERIVMYPDGSWRPVEAGDSVLIRQYLQRTDVMPQPQETFPKPRERTKAEAQEYLRRQWNEMYDLLIAEEKKVQDEFRSATNAQFNAGAQLANAEANKKLIEPDQLASLRETYESSIQTLRVAKLRQKKIQSIVSKGRKINDRPEALTESKLNGLKVSFQSYANTFSLLASSKATPTEKPSSRDARSKPAVPPKPAKETPPDKKNMPAAPVHQGLPVHRKPPARVSSTQDCFFSTEVVDEATGRKKTALEPERLFSHTDPDLRPYFKDRDLITCTGQLSKTGPYQYVTIRFEIASSHSQKNFGSLQSGSLLRVKLLNGDFVSLYNLKSDRGRIDAYSGHTIFTGHYALGKDEIRQLQRSETDKIRVLWATGYEDYEVYNVDFFIHQLDCLQANN